MIHITELATPRKMPGRTSFLITFDFKPEIVDAVKTIPTYYYHKTDYSWEIPACYLAAALDALTFLDDIRLTLLSENRVFSGLAPLTDSEINSFKVKPFKHQIEAVNYGLATDTGKWLLLDSMGVGKTGTLIYYAEALKMRGLIDHCMIICGIDSLRTNWKNEIKKFSNQGVLVLGEKVSKKGNISYTTMPERAKQLKAPIQEFFVIINAATIRSDKIIEAFKSGSNKFGMIAVDEAHRFATKTSQQGSNLLKMKAMYKVAATGTLITNNPLSAYVPLAWTENDHATLTTYKSTYCCFGGFGGNQIIGYKNLDLLKDEIDSCMLRRTLDQVRDSMPPKTVEYELIEMSDEHRKFYDAVVSGVKEEVDKINLNANNTLALTTRLRQATACPGILTTQDIESSKVVRCCELVEELLEQNEKVVVMSVFKDTVYRLQKLLAKYNPLIGTGDVSDQVVQDNVSKFQNDPNSKLFICTHDKCGTGITLNAASYMIIVDTPYTDAKLSQSTDRIWRVTNTRPVYITILACADSIDERVRDIVDTKKDYADYIVDGKENTVAASLTDELKKIISSL